MTMTAFVRRAALVTLTALCGLLPGSASAFLAEPAGEANTQTTDVHLYENLVCLDCGESEPFWVHYTQEGGKGGRQPAPEGCHWKMTMCLNCGTINADLPVDSRGKDLDLFRLEEHVYTGVVTAPTCTEGGYTTETCPCGYTRRTEETPPAGHQFGEWTVEREPTEDEEGLRRRACLVCGWEETEILPRLTKEPGPGEGETPPEEPGPGEGETPPEEPGPGEGETPPEEPGPGEGETPPKEPGPGEGETPPEEPGPGEGETPPEEPGPGEGETPPEEPGPGEGETPPEEPGPGEGETPPEEPGPGEGETPPEEPGPGEGETPPEEPGPGEGETPPEEPGPGEGKTPPVDPAPEEKIPVPVESEDVPAVVFHGAYMNGLPGGIFAPDRAMTRAEAAVMLERLLPETADACPTGAFRDVPADAWYAHAVDRLAALGLVQGRGSGLFDPETAITGDELAELITRCLGDEAAARAAVSSSEPVTRAEAVAAMNRVLNRQADRTYIADHPDQMRCFTDVGPDHWAWYDIQEATTGHKAVSHSQEIWGG